MSHVSAIPVVGHPVFRVTGHPATRVVGNLLIRVGGSLSVRVAGTPLLRLLSRRVTPACSWPQSTEIARGATDVNRDQLPAGMTSVVNGRVVGG